MGGCRLHPWTVGLAATLVVGGMAQAAGIYRSIDANGTVVYSDHVDPALSQTVELHLEDPRYPPREMHLCGTQNCFTLVLDQGSYRRVDGTDDVWTVRSFTPTAVVLDRHGASTGGKDVIYAGDIANDRLVNVSVDGIAGGGIDASWGSALNTLPADNTERDAHAVVSGAVAPPPPLPAEEQPPLPQADLVWVPGYWNWGTPGYVWVPGAWMHAPHAGYLWTPAWWALVGAHYLFHPGYWGPTVGYYGGINYGHGYPGNGYVGVRGTQAAFSYTPGVNRAGGSLAGRNNGLAPAAPAAAAAHTAVAAPAAARPRPAAVPASAPKPARTAPLRVAAPAK